MAARSMRPILAACADLPERSFAAGEAIIEDGKMAGVLYILVEGTVEVVKGDVQITTVSEPGSIFGEVSVLLNSDHMAQVRTLVPSRFRVVEDAGDFLASRPDIMFHVARLLAQRLSYVTGYLVDLKRQFDDQRDHLGMVDEVLESLVHHQGED
jgi:CRP/FNR family cyclic AMP-dependent transcriptional regulator